MRKAKSFRRDLYKQFDFELNLAALQNPLRMDGLLQAIGLGRPFYRTCTHLNIDAEPLADLVKDQLLYDLWAQSQYLSSQQMECLKRYPDEMLCGQSLSTVQSKIRDLEASNQLTEEQDHLTAFIYYAAKQMQTCKLLISDDPEELDKHQAVIKTVGLLGLLRSPQIQALLLDNLLNEGRPFDYDNMAWARDIPDLDLSLIAMIKEHHLYADDVKEGQIALLLSLIGTIEQALPLFIRDAVTDLFKLLYPVSLTDEHKVDQADYKGLLQLKQHLLPFVLLSKIGTHDTPYDLSNNPLYTVVPDVPDCYLSPVHHWVNQVRRQWMPHADLRYVRIYWMRHLQENLLRESDVIWDNCLDIGQHFRKWAGITPHHLGLEDISTGLADGEDEWESPPAAPPKRSLHRS